MQGGDYVRSSVEALWRLSWKADPRGRPLADRHYNRRKPGALQFAPPARTCVLLTEAADALWITIHQNYTRHAWPGAWVCSLFRNEGPILSSRLIVSAVAATRAKFGAPPPHGIVTMVDPEKTRRKRDPGRCFRKAGFREVGTTERGLIVLQMAPDEMPTALAALPTIRAA